MFTENFVLITVNNASVICVNFIKVKLIVEKSLEYIYRVFGRVQGELGSPCDVATCAPAGCHVATIPIPFILYKITIQLSFFFHFLLYLVPNSKNDTFFFKKKCIKSIDKV